MAKKIQDYGVHSIADIITLLFEWNAEGEGKIRWGDKTPYYVLNMPLLKKHFPSAKFIHIIRDGRDCAISMFNRQADFGIINMYHAAKYWQQYVEIGAIEGHQLGASDYIEIRYEDLLENTEHTLRKICVFLDEPFYDTLIHFKKSGEEGKTPLLQQPIQKHNKNKWKKTMSPNAIKIFEGAVGLTLKKHAYALINPTYKMPLLRKIYYRYLIILNHYKNKILG
jgi:hypothetical protein